MKKLLLFVFLTLFSVSPVLADPVAEADIFTGYEATAGEEDLFTSYEEAEEQSSFSDPLYYYNKGMFWVNDKFYFYLLKPVATGYSYVVPKPARIGIRNFFENLGMPVRFVSNVLQLRFKEAGQELVLFGVNSTVGVLGFGKPGQEFFGWNNTDEDLGQALGSYGIGGGPYIVLPLLGPSNLRDTVGLVGDAFLNPLLYIGANDEIKYGATTTEVVNATSLRLGQYEAVIDSAVDPYTSIKDGYTTLRDKKIAE